MAELDQVAHDYPRDEHDKICEEFDDLYLKCGHGNKVYAYGHDGTHKGAVWLEAYIPSVKRARNILKSMYEIGVSYSHYSEGDGEATFRFKGVDLDKIANLLEVRTAGAGISPFSVKNYPSSNVCIPQENMALYKDLTNSMTAQDKLQIARITNQFLDEELTVALQNRDKSFNRKADMCKMCLRKQPKEYIYVKGFWDEYIQYLKEAVE